MYAYYGGVDKTAHERGFGEFYDAELRAADRIVGDILDVLVPGSTLLVTADHGQVEVGDRVIAPDPRPARHGGAAIGGGTLPVVARVPRRGRRAAGQGGGRRYGDVAWVVTREQVVDEDWFGATVAPPVLGRLGDVALVARDPVSFFDPADAGPFELVCRHGSLTAAEVLVPLLASVPS